MDKAVLPIENSVAGSIHRNYDLLLRHRLHIVGEVQLLVNHCLLGLPGVEKEELKCVLSHPQVGLSLISFFIFYLVYVLSGMSSTYGMNAHHCPIKVPICYTKFSRWIELTIWIGMKYFFTCMHMYNLIFEMKDPGLQSFVADICACRLLLNVR